MTRTQLEAMLANIGIHSSSYLLDGIRHSDCLCLVRDDAKWKVCYVERDKPEELGSFDQIESAHKFIYATFHKWLDIEKS